MTTQDYFQKCFGVPLSKRLFKKSRMECKRAHTEFLNSMNRSDKVDVNKKSEITEFSYQHYHQCMNLSALAHLFPIRNMQCRIAKTEMSKHFKVTCLALNGKPLLIPGDVIVVDELF